MLVQAFQEDFLLPYQRFSEAIQQHLSQTPTDLFKVALWIACGYLERELFEDYLLTDESSYFITHDEEIETLPLQNEWFWQLPTFIHQKLAQTKHQEKITTELIKKIRFEQASEQLLNLYFDIYQR